MIYVFSALLALAVLICVLLNVSVTLKVQYDKQSNVFRCTAHYLFLTHVLAPKEEKKKKKSKKKKTDKSPKKEDKKTSFADRIRETGLVGFIDDIKDIVKGAWGLIVCVLRRSVLKEFTLHLSVAGEDAADTAVLYGMANGVLYPIITLILENVREYKELDVEISPDFSEEAEADFEFSAQLKLKPVRFLSAVFESREELGRLVSAIRK
ncbi:MAG: DUF2953 domain-containing protein [Ruminococcus sp.]|nr:DUF2953 domain-containing protein [Ruminococcus sp.]